ncbi:MAG TPA: hypothetical protein P5123_03385 [Spirochaetota bacterium]|nr:hypothetical protein [Spirochaetota bacterium]
MRFISIRFFLCLAAVIFLQSQMPGWLSITDNANNHYYVTPTGKIITNETPDFTYKPVSFEGIDYYLQQGEILSQKFNKFEGLLLLKSIRYLGDIDERIMFESARAASLITKLKNREGDRFKKLNSNASILLYSFNKQTTLFNDFSNYRINLNDAQIFILNRAVRDDEFSSNDSFSAGLKFSATGDDSTSEYDAVIFASVIKNRYSKYKSVEHFRKHLVQRRGSDSFERDTIKKDENYLLSSFTFTKTGTKENKLLKDTPSFNGKEALSAEDSGKKQFVGYEVLTCGKNSGLLLQIMVSGENGAAYDNKIKDIALSLEATL